MGKSIEDKDSTRLEPAWQVRTRSRSLSDDAKRQAPDRPQYKNAYEAIRSAFVEAGAIGDEFAQIMDEIEADRKRHAGRPVQDFE